MHDNRFNPGERVWYDDTPGKLVSVNEGGQATVDWDNGMRGTADASDLLADDEPECPF